MTGSARTFCRFGSNVCHVERVPRCPSLPACAEHSLLVRATRTCAVQLRYPLQLRRGSTASRLLCVSNEQLRRSEVCCAWFCTQHLPVWARAPAGLWVAPFFQSFKVCFKLPHATYLTTNAVAFWWFRWGLFVRWKEHTPLSLSHPFWIWSRVSLNMEPLRENKPVDPRLLVAQPRAPAGRRAHATNGRLTCIGFCGSPHH